ncbi:hypothetical protein EXN22_15045 [Pseudomonas tructae]|uniref:Uncharacterized protein n=1 Tax=Pseudomonas tructae TaxID=2518644 RepID=A0A411MJH3_9PSED|nr:profilin [Pseudomonas tructae]QBF26940.1 hypothetical protein EXN22_15045 [Pseudomonas tructae]
MWDWVLYVDQMTRADLSEAAVAGLDGRIHSHSSGFAATQAELRSIARFFAGQSELPARFYLNNTEYHCLDQNEVSIRGANGSLTAYCEKARDVILIALGEGSIHRSPITCLAAQLRASAD